MNITAINVFIEVDGKQTMAFIGKEQAELFVRMLPSFQDGQPNAPKLYTLPASVAAPLEKTRAALYDCLMKPKAAEKGQTP
ncbi:MAG TPA: hypothetical protein DDZ62_03350 [Delftia acidovorans]|uniref:Uncharacterized protein n=1 Tax=Delftia lacustris TaxID=558537 RepID=A0A7T2YX11_9BURK|nr:MULTISPECIES: hypothetical protein [Delftia]EPD40890.1 hypothetical protein HMPREF9702_03459 [Delftia acidovorans CCUG 15835]QPS83324.1 hypothetical protein I6G47_09755 [Delftia lacustris]HBJ99101.1 hypothetical protein [Delftia acidovorans]